MTLTVFRSVQWLSTSHRASICPLISTQLHIKFIQNRKANFKTLSRGRSSYYIRQSREVRVHHCLITRSRHGPRSSREPHRPQSQRNGYSASPFGAFAKNQRQGVPGGIISYTRIAAHKTNRLTSEDKEYDYRDSWGIEKKLKCTSLIKEARGQTP